MLLVRSVAFTSGSAVFAVFAVDMGSGLVAAFFGKKSAEKTNELKERPSKRQGQPIERRPPVTTVSELVAVGPEGFERIQFALDFAPLGTSLRWNKLLSALNRHIEPTEDVPDPLRVDFSMDEMKKGLNMLFKRTTLGRGYELAQEIVPAIYDKHSFERAKRVSQRERNAIPLPDECFAYGELGLPQFALIYYKICAAYGNIKGNFYDLGCGVGNLVYAAAILGSGNFQRCIGVENINALAERGTKRLLRWQKYAEKLPSAYQTITIDFVQVTNHSSINIHL